MRYSAEFKRDAVALARQSGSQRQVHRDLGVSKSALSKWVAHAERASQGLPATRDVTPTEDAQIRELIKRNRCRVAGAGCGGVQGAEVQQAGQLPVVEATCLSV